MNPFSFRFRFLFIVLVSVASQAATPLNLAAINLVTGQKVAVSSTQGKKGLIIVFMAATCPCSNSHVDELKDLAETFKDFQFVAVHSNQDEDPLASKDYFLKLNLPFPVLQDQGAKIADQLKAFKTPHAFLFSPDGTLLYQGGVTNSADAHHADKKLLREALLSLSAGKSIADKEGRTLGCVISRKIKNVW